MLDQPDDFNHRRDELAELIRRATADPNLADTVVQRVAAAAADGAISRSQLRHQLTYIANGRRNGTIKRPGAYFVTCAKELFARAGIPWSTAPTDA